MEYPQQIKIHGMIQLLYRELNKASEQGRADLKVEYKNGRDSVGVSIAGNKAPEDDVAHLLSVSDAQAVRLFRYVCREGFVHVSPQSDLSRSHSLVSVENISDSGLLEIGELPDPQQRFLMGLEAAIQAIREDDRIPYEEKKRGIEWAEEGKHLARPLVVEVFKAMWRGELPLS